MIHFVFAVLNALNCYRYSSSVIVSMTEVRYSINFKFVLGHFALLLTARYYR